MIKKIILIKYKTAFQQIQINIYILHTILLYIYYLYVMLLDSI